MLHVDIVYFPLLPLSPSFSIIVSCRRAALPPCIILLLLLNSTVETLYQSLLPNLPQYMIALLKILLAAAPTSKAKTDSINILADVLPEEMPTTVLQSMKLGKRPQGFRTL